MHLTRGAMEFLQEMIALDAMRLFRAVVSEVRFVLSLNCILVSIRKLLEPGPV